MIQFVEKKHEKLLKTWWFFTYFAQSAWAFWIHPINDRASRAQSLQNMRAREQNREHRARGLALKSGLIIRLFYRARLSSRSSAWRPFSFSASIEIRFCVVLLSNFVFPAFALSSTVKRILRRFRSSLCAKRVFCAKLVFRLAPLFLVYTRCLLSSWSLPSLHFFC